MNCYIYYKSAASDEQQVIHQASIHLSLLATAGIDGSLQRRPQVAQGLHTWMEVYHNISDDFLHQMENALNISQLDSLIEGDRHMEFFTPVALCA